MAVLMNVVIVVVIVALLLRVMILFPSLYFSILVALVQPPTHAWGAVRNPRV
jgi:hypothetical protein